MIFAVILEGAWPINNYKKLRLCGLRCLRKSEITGLIKHASYSIYTSLSGGRRDMSDSPL